MSMGAIVAATLAVVAFKDAEVEINGLMTYDRKVLKYDPKILKAAHSKIVTAAREAATSR